eukprot:5497897-Amphidinium_carterae.1
MALPAEEGLCGGADLSEKGKVSPSLIEDANMARSYVEKVMATMDDPDAASMQETMQRTPTNPFKLPLYIKIESQKLGK